MESEGHSMNKYLTLDEILKLPDGTLVVVIWSGGNGPHEYKTVRRGDRVYARTPLDERLGLDVDYERDISRLVGEPPCTTVRLK